MKQKNRRIMSANKSQAATGLKAAVICGLIGGSFPALADDSEVPDLAFLEYLGSWEESDEDWVLFSDEEKDAEPDNKANGTDPAPLEENVAELDDEN